MFPINPLNFRVKVKIIVDIAVNTICEAIPVVALNTAAIPEQCGAGVVRIAWIIPKKVGAAQKYDKSWITAQLNMPIETNTIIAKTMGFFMTVRI